MTPEIEATTAHVQEASLQEALDRLTNQNEYLSQRCTNLRALYNRATEMLTHQSEEIKSLTDQLDAFTTNPDPMLDLTDMSESHSEAPPPPTLES